MPKPKNLLVATIASITFIFFNVSSAACAWIAWTKTESKAFWKEMLSKEKITDANDWQVWQSFDDKKQCVAAIESKVNGMTTKMKADLPPELKVSASMTDTYGAVSVRYKTGTGDQAELHTTDTEFLCVPDTIDPRGKK